MTLFNPEIQSIEEDILYHETQIKEAQERLDQLKVSRAYSDDVISSLEDFFENTDPFMYEILQGHLNQMFDENKVTPNKDFNQSLVTQEVKKEEASQKEVKEETPTKPTSVSSTTGEPEKEFGSLSYHELTGKPDLRPDTFEDLAPNITYSSSGRAYVEFNDRSEAEEFLNNLSEPAMIGEENTMNGFKYEVKFYCSKEYIQEIADSTNSMSEDVQTPNFEKIDCELIYNHADSICYVAGRAKGRLDNYGSYLTRILDIAEKYTVSNKPSFFDSKYELRLEGFNSFEDALHLQSFDLKKEYSDRKNEEARSLWRDTRKRVYPSACKPLPHLAKLDEVKLGDIVYLNSIDNQYKVLNKVELDGVPHIEVLCVYNPERQSLVGVTSYLRECYLVPSDRIQIDPQFQVTKDSPNLQPVKSQVLSEKDFPSAPYKLLPLAEVEICDVISTGEHITTYYEVTQNLGTCIKARCLYSRAFPKRVGEEYTLSTVYLVEKSTDEVIAA